MYYALCYNHNGHKVARFFYNWQDALLWRRNCMKQYSKTVSQFTLHKADGSEVDLNTMS